MSPPITSTSAFASFLVVASQRRSPMALRVCSVAETPLASPIWSLWNDATATSQLIVESVVFVVTDAFLTLSLAPPARTSRMAACRLTAGPRQPFTNKAPMDFQGAAIKIVP